jgi:hypothetical protein
VYVWNCARTWRTPAPPSNADALDWQKVIEIGQSNRMQTLLHQVLRATGMMVKVPPAACEALQQDVIKLTHAASRMGNTLRQYLRRAAEQGLESVILKGLSVSINVYGNPAMRPGADIDILVRADHVQVSLDILEEIGIGQHWPNLLDDRYYQQHHLHQQRCSEDLRIWFEVHWALDHPYTLLTIDYEALMDRTTPGELLGEPVNNLSLPDLVLSLAIHLVKHAIYLPSVLHRPDLARIILADGMLMYYLDIAEVIRRHQAEIDWALTVDLAHQWGAVDILGSVLRVCEDYLDTPVPAWVMTSLPVKGPGPLTQRAMNGLADYEIATYLGQASSRMWDFFVVPNGAFILRPIRLLDSGAYCFPGKDFLCRRYGTASSATATKHLLRALGQYGRNGFDTLYYSLERYRRLKALGQSASLFNRLEID